MGIYAITGGTKGIGAEALTYLRGHGHEVINIDIDGGDITADLGTADGRQKVIATLRERCPGAVLYCDGGTSAFLHSEKFY